MGVLETMEEGEMLRRERSHIFPNIHHRGLSENG